jgi:hypothetical protein
MLRIRANKTCWIALWCFTAFVNVLPTSYADAASLDLDGRYTLDAEETQNSAPFLKLMAKNPAEKMGFQIFAQLMDSLLISGQSLKSSVLECKLEKADVGFNALCVNALTTEKVSYEIVVDGAYLVLLEKQYPIFFKAPTGKVFPKLD